MIPRNSFRFGHTGGELRFAFEGIGKALKGCARKALVDLIVLPEDGTKQFIDEDGVIDVRFDDLSWAQFQA